MQTCGHCGKDNIPAQATVCGACGARYGYKNYSSEKCRQVKFILGPLYMLFVPLSFFIMAILGIRMENNENEIASTVLTLATIGMIVGPIVTLFCWRTFWDTVVGKKWWRRVD